VGDGEVEEGVLEEEVLLGVRLQPSSAQSSVRGASVKSGCQSEQKLPHQ
jgi:hypothetical protein